MKVFEIIRTTDGKIKLIIFGKSIFGCMFPTKYNKIYTKRFKGLTKQETRYILEKQFEWATGNKLNLDNPVTFDEKIQWMKLNYRNPLMTKCADKFAVRQYIKETIGEQYLVQCLGVYDSVEEIDFDKLPNKFVLKVNWGCKQNIIVKDKSKLDIDEAKKQLKIWLNPKSNYYYRFLEWQYKDIKPKILCEQYVDSYVLANEYKLFCIGGKCKFLSVVDNSHKKTIITFFDTSLNVLPFRKFAYKNDINYKLEISNGNKMVELAEKLAKPFPQVRVDFYNDINNEIKFGELTFTSSDGHNNFQPKEWNIKFGDMFELPKI